MSIKLGINGLGRIGRLALRNVWGSSDFEVVGINSRSSAKHYAHLLKYDSSYGIWDVEISHEGNEALMVDGKRIPLYHELDPINVPWGDRGADVVIESTGVFRSREDSLKHIKAGAKKVFISSPAADADVTLVRGVNLSDYNSDKHHIISAASCTSNCLAPVVKILHENFIIKHGYLVTIHAYTNDQNLVDAPHKNEDLRRARAAYESIIPTSTGAAQTIGLLMPELKGKLSGISMRVPVVLPSVINVSMEVSKKTSAKEVNNMLLQASHNGFNEIMRVSGEPLVSIDYKKDPHASIIDAPLTKVMDDTFVTVVSWYDNEWGYVHQMNQLIKAIMKEG
jgi:glyceraldehyde 3-phosphate dehydrogenase